MLKRSLINILFLTLFCVSSNAQDPSPVNSQHKKNVEERQSEIAYNAEIARAEQAGEIKTEAQLDALLATAVASDKVKDVVTYLDAKDKREKKEKATKADKKVK